MTDTKPSNAPPLGKPDEKLRATTSRLVAEAAGMICLAALTILILVFVGWVIAAVSHADHDLSQTAASWVQAFSAPLAIAGAFYVARYQANRQEAEASRQRAIAETAAREATLAAAGQARLDVLEREAAALIYAQGTLLSAAGTLNSMFQSMSKAHLGTHLTSMHAEILTLAHRTVAKLDPAGIPHGRSQVGVIRAIFATEAMCTYLHKTPKLTTNAAYSVAKSVISKLAVPITDLETRIGEVSTELVGGGRDPVAPVYALRDKTWGDWWLAETAKFEAGKKAKVP
jgi:hypothetical protein